MKTLQVTDEKVRAAADSCPTAATVLKTMFPEAFESRDGKYFQINKLEVEQDSADLFTRAKALAAGFDSSRFIQVRAGGRYMNKGFLLSSDYHWQIETDEYDCMVLVPTRK